MVAASLGYFFGATRPRDKKMIKIKGWTKKLEKTLTTYPDVDGYYDNSVLIEAGANAMLELLSNKGIKVQTEQLGWQDALGLSYNATSHKGTLVFIPDVEDLLG